MANIYKNFKPSQIVRAMIDGLLDVDKSTDQIVDMACFGYYALGEQQCSMCAASAAIQKLLEKKYPSNVINLRFRRADFLGADLTTQHRFEWVLDELRKGNPFDLFNFLDLPFDPSLVYDLEWHLDNSIWAQELPKLEKFHDVLVRRGF